MKRTFSILDLPIGYYIRAIEYKDKTILKIRHDNNIDAWEDVFMWIKLDKNGYVLSYSSSTSLYDFRTIFDTGLRVGDKFLYKDTKNKNIMIIKGDE